MKEQLANIRAQAVVTIVPPCLEATCRVKDAIVFFADGYCEPGEESSYQGTCIWAYSLRWRFLPKEFSGE